MEKKEQAYKNEIARLKERIQVNSVGLIAIRIGVGDIHVISTYLE
jgi:hypothetical protein